MLLLGYFEGLDSERAIAWRAADSLSVRSFLRLEFHEAPPDHSTASRTRRLIDVETHQVVFTWVLQRPADAKLVKGKTIGIDATTLEANAALCSIVRRGTGESYDEFLTLRFSPERAAVVKRLNEAVVAVVGIPLFPVNEGYYFTADNAAAAASRYELWKDWTARHGLVWDWVGLDIEPEARFYEQIMANPWGLVRLLAPRLSSAACTRAVHGID